MKKVKSKSDAEQTREPATSKQELEQHTVGDSWIPLDASFKQYEYTEGEDIASAVPFDAEGLVAQIEASATINEDEG